MTALFVRNGKLELWGGGSTPWHFDRLRWWGVKGAVEAKCQGCERSRVARWSWHGGGEGLPGVSSQDGSFSTPLRTRLSESLAERASGSLAAPLRTQKGHSPRQASEDGEAAHHQKTTKVVSYEKRLRGQIVYV